MFQIWEEIFIYMYHLHWLSDSSLILCDLFVLGLIRKAKITMTSRWAVSAEVDNEIKKHTYFQKAFKKHSSIRIYMH